MPVSFKSFSLGLQLAFWAVLFSIVFYVSASNADAGVAVERIALVFACHLITFYTCFSFIVPRYFEKKRYAATILSFVVLFVVLTPLRIMIERHFTGLRVFAVNVRRLNRVGLGLIVFSEIAVGAFACLVKLAASSFINRQNMEAMQRLQLESELKFLKAQMSPHFLFNTINNIYALTLIKSDKAPKFLLKLSGLLRYLLYECDKPVTYLQEENALLIYSELFRLRYDETLDIQLHFEVTQKEKLLEPLLLIPILENAFKYSGLGVNGAAFVSFIVTEANGRLNVTCKNSINQEHVQDQNGGIGLTNIKKRLEAGYPDNHVFNVLKSDNLFTLNLTLPLI